MPENNVTPGTPVPQPQPVQPVVVAQPKPVVKEILYRWKAPMRHFKKMDIKKYWVLLAGVLGLFVVLAILGQFWFMAAIASVMFLLYVLGTVPPVEVEHLISTIGVETLEKEYKWEELAAYWFSRRDEQLILNIDTKLRIPARVIMLINPADQANIQKILVDRLTYKDFRKQGKVSKITDGEWLPMDNTNANA